MLTYLVVNQRELPLEYLLPQAELIKVSFPFPFLSGKALVLLLYTMTEQLLVKVEFSFPFPFLSGTALVLLLYTITEQLPVKVGFSFPVYLSRIFTWCIFWSGSAFVHPHLPHSALSKEYLL